VAKEEEVASAVLERARIQLEPAALRLGHHLELPADKPLLIVHARIVCRIAG